MQNSRLSYCGEMVREHDPDRFLLSMFMPAKTREALWAIFAFNYEIAKTREVVSETQLGLIRLQWWREAIEKIYKGEKTEDHEVLKALENAIKTHDLPYEHFEKLVYAREFDLEDVLPGNLEGLINYADFTTTPLLKLATQITGGDLETEPVQPIAINYALSGIIRAIPFHANQRRCLLPEDLLQANNVKTNQLYEHKPQNGMPSIIKAIAGEITPDIRSDNKLLQLSQNLAIMHTKRLKRLKYNIFHAKAALPLPFKAFRLTWHALRAK